MKLRSRYLLVGVWNSIFGISNFLLLSLIFSQWSDLSVLSASYLISIVQAHIAQRRLVWQSHEPYLPELIRFTSAYFAQFAINSALLVLSESWMPVDRELRQIAIIVFLTILFYFVNKKGVFRVAQ
jgi:putative flippase GtrA